MADTRAEFIAGLKALRKQAGQPTLGELERQNTRWLATSSVSDMLGDRRTGVPNWERVKAFVVVCGRIGRS